MDKPTYSQAVRAADLFEALCVVDPATGEDVPVYEPDPDKPRRYRETVAARRIEGKAERT